MDPIPLFGPVPGGMEMTIILLVAVLLFGANKLPELARSTGSAMGEFKKGREDVEREIREAAEAVEHDADPVGDAGTERDPADEETSV
jgi:sec-independent protein translocase protein TatA